MGFEGAAAAVLANWDEINPSLSKQVIFFIIHKGLVKLQLTKGIITVAAIVQRGTHQKHIPLDVLGHVHLANASIFLSGGLDQSWEDIIRVDKAHFTLIGLWLVLRVTAFGCDVGIGLGLVVVSIITIVINSVIVMMIIVVIVIVIIGVGVAIIIGMEWANTGVIIIIIIIVVVVMVMVIGCCLGVGGRIWGIWGCSTHSLILVIIIIGPNTVGLAAIVLMRCELGKMVLAGAGRWGGVHLLGREADNFVQRNAGHLPLLPQLVIVGEEIDDGLGLGSDFVPDFLIFAVKVVGDELMEDSALAHIIDKPRIAVQEEVFDDDQGLVDVLGAGVVLQALSKGCKEVIILLGALCICDIGKGHEVRGGCRIGFILGRVTNHVLD